MTCSEKDANIKSRVEEGTLIIEVSGQVSMETIREIRCETFRRVVMSDQVKRRLLDFSRGDVTLSASEWAQLGDEQLSGHKLAIPTAVLVGAATLTQAWRYSDRMNDAGRAYVAFKSEEDAYLWANVAPPRAPSPQGSRGRSPATRGRARPPGSQGR